MNSGAIDELQERVTHQELAIEALNETVVRQEREIAELRDALDGMRQLLRELRPSPLDGHAADEPPPPHY